MGCPVDLGFQIAVFLHMIHKLVYDLRIYVRLRDGREELGEEEDASWSTGEDW
jgi:hypothetical protein